MPIEVQLGTAISFICGEISQANLKVKKELRLRIKKLNYNSELDMNHKAPNLNASPTEKVSVKYYAASF